MRKSDFHYSLPHDLIAQYPATSRTASRLLALDGASGARRDLRFTDLPALLRAGDLLVFNDTRVISARLFGHKDSGGRIEVLVERILDTHRVLAQLRASKPPKPGQKLTLEGNVTMTVQQREGEFHHLQFETDAPVTEILERIGHVPLPPYIERADNASDSERYQTVYAHHPGAVAAPTAGLHFDEAMIARLQGMGAESAFVTLHVGAGTFQPIRVDDIREHRMHAEYLSVSQVACDKINTAKREGRRVVAVGTTVVRALETAADNGSMAPYEGETEIFIYPGYRFRVVDALLTNFHLPESTLLMLVCAFGGTESVLNAYRHAVQQKYRFYSYGDAMFVTPA
ncbi:MAG: tRNA preQ1(34) S-adenosylmethionine ribosyltransferase-isomerase QueA [Pseudomonadota bacterium]